MLRDLYISIFHSPLPIVLPATVHGYPLWYYAIPFGYVIGMSIGVLFCRGRRVLYGAPSASGLLSDHLFPHVSAGYFGGVLAVWVIEFSGKW